MIAGVVQDEADLANCPQLADRGFFEELTREGAERFLEALEFLMMTIPQYDLPEITEDGDIIIRRRRPGATPPAPEDNDPTMDQT